MNRSQRILTYVAITMIPLTLFFVPWRVQNGPKTDYVISPFWRPVFYDGVTHEVDTPLYAEWGVLAAGFAVVYFCLRDKKGISDETCA